MPVTPFGIFADPSHELLPVTTFEAIVKVPPPLQLTGPSGTAADAGVVSEPIARATATASAAPRDRDQPRPDPWPVRTFEAGTFEPGTVEPGTCAWACASMRVDYPYQPAWIQTARNQGANLCA